MDLEQIKLIISMVIDELTSRNLIKADDYQKSAVKDTEKKLYQFFNNHGDGYGINHALNILSDDPYMFIIFMKYKENKTLEYIAEYSNKDVSTIKRNKKRLILSIYQILNDIEVN